MSKSRASLLDGPLVFVDIETNGLDHVRGRVIEVAAIRVEAGEVVQTFQSLIDPEANLPGYITNLTGITTNDLKGAPTFDVIADELSAVLAGAIFVAHNVRFDYSFLKQEFGRLGVAFLPTQLCTVKLSRALYPLEKGHKLQDLIQRHGLSFAARHRAYDDAAVLEQFIAHIRRQFPPEQVELAVSRQFKQPALPKSLLPELVRDLPETPGVYIFEDASGNPLYIGKSINIKKRVLSHFGRDHASVKEFKIAQTVGNITTHQTGGELMALLLESRLIKELSPLHNRRLRRTQKLIVAKQTVDATGYAGVVTEEVTAIDPTASANMLAVYPSRAKAKAALTEISKLYGLCPKLLGLEKSAGACFQFQLKQCAGACLGQESVVRHNLRLHTAFERQRIQNWPYKGAILLQERSFAQPEYAILVDQWCVLGEVTMAEHCEPVVHVESRAFDLDTYKILQMFISTKIETLKIQVLSPQQAQTFGI